MKHTQVGVYPVLSVTVLAGVLGLAGYAASGETTGLAGFTQAVDQNAAASGLSAPVGAGRCRRPRCHHADKGGSEAGWESDDAGSAR
jgi:hypothetical protein